MTGLYAKGMDGIEDVQKRSFAETLTEICTFAHEPVDWNTAIQPVHCTLRLMMMYHGTKFACQRISSSEVR